MWSLTISSFFLLVSSERIFLVLCFGVRDTIAFLEIFEPKDLWPFHLPFIARGAFYQLFTKIGNSVWHHLIAIFNYFLQINVPPQNLLDSDKQGNGKLATLHEFFCRGYFKSVMITHKKIVTLLYDLCLALPSVRF